MFRSADDLTDAPDLISGAGRALNGYLFFLFFNRVGVDVDESLREEPSSQQVNY